MKTLLLDNYDSFTYNLFQLIAGTNGEEPTVWPNDAVSWAEIENAGFDNIVLSPGPGRPERENDFGVCADALRCSHVPILGVCLGHQGLGHTYGARVIYAPEVMHGRISSILHDGSALFAGIPQRFQAVRYHSLVVDPHLPGCLRKIAWTSDGVLMGLQHRTRPFWGVQFHPESLCTEFGARLLCNFRDQSRLSNAPRSGFRTAEFRPQPVRKSTSTACPLVPLSTDLTLSVERLPVWVDPETAFLRLYAGADAAFWLDSSLAVSGLSRFSYMGDAAGPLGCTLRYALHSGQWTATRGGRTERVQGGGFDALEATLAAVSVSTGDAPFDFCGGLVGYLGYEMKAECGGAQRHLSPAPDAAFIFVDRFLAFDHQEKTLYLAALCAAPERAAATDWFAATSRRLLAERPEETPAMQPPCAARAPLTVRLERTAADYRASISEARKALYEGESYEICLTNRIHLSALSDPLRVYLRLRRSSPAPYAAFLRLPDVTVLSSSPERFLKIDRERIAESKPIKGTARRGGTPEEDRRLRRGLQHGSKDRAENLMIADLLRNDLGRVCMAGSVEVPLRMEVETYATVHQLVTTVQGRLRPETGAVDCLRSLFPGGSMTGAPKIRTMRILDDLEPVARGVYSGALGLLSLNGTVDLNIVIRTLVQTSAGTTLGIGGAITALSDPAEEFEETLLKARGVLSAVLEEHAPGRGDALLEQTLQSLRQAGRITLEPESGASMQSPGPLRRATYPS